MTKTSPKTWVMACVLVAALLALLLPLGACASTGSGGTAETTYTLDGATCFTFSDDSIAAEEGSYSGYKIDGTALTINDAGTYAVSGSCADGSITIKKGTTGVTLVLNGLILTSSDTAPIACNKSTEVTIVAADGTVNTLTDAAENNDDSYPDNENAENAVIKCKDGSVVTLCGTGTLNINANGKNGIKSGATTDEEGEASLTIRDLTLNLSVPVNDAVNAEQLLNVESGTLTISAADDALHCDLVMNIGADGTAGPTIDITECYEGIEAATLNIFSGDISINSSDDCLNAANGDLTGYSFSMTISGGSIYAYASSGDGFDSNGDLTISGGTVVVWTANTADNQPLDADGTLTVSGGTVLAAGGSSGMGVRTSAAQPYVTFGSTGGMGGFRAQGSASSLLPKGTAFTITDADGSTVYSGTAVCNANYVFFSSPDLSESESCTLSAAGTTVSTAAAQAGTTSGGFSGGMGGQRPDGTADGTTPPERPDGAADGTTPPALPDGQTPPDGQEPPEGITPPENFDGAQPPTLPDGAQPPAKPDNGQPPRGADSPVKPDEAQTTAAA